ncbi:hypothetical protein B0H14DRAFT_1062789 [Mycena olivaceomarginata]|nr:hypothetical protein B0H14DRAFT_1062789 [Mycena olivaceomarginata]
MGRDSLSSSARIASEVPHPTRQRRDFQCPKQDREGASLSSHGFTTISINGSSGTTALTCTYDDGAGECTYSEDGVFQSGLSACPGGAEEPIQPACAISLSISDHYSCLPYAGSTTPATTETQKTQTKTGTQITDPLPSTPTSTIPILSPSPSSASSASPSSQPPSSTFSSSSAAKSLPAVSSSSVVPTSQTSSTSLPFVDQTTHASRYALNPSPLAPSLASPSAHSQSYFSPSS